MIKLAAIIKHEIYFDLDIGEINDTVGFNIPSNLIYELCDGIDLLNIQETLLENFSEQLKIDIDVLRQGFTLEAKTKALDYEVITGQYP